MGSITLDQWIQISSVVVQLIAIVASGYYIGMQIKSAKKSEIEFKVHELHKEQYSKLMSLLRKVVMSARNQEKYNLDINEWLDIQMGMSMYASGNVLKAYVDILKLSKNNKDLGSPKLGELILQMRNEVGLDNTNLTSRDVLTPFLSDINDPQFDQYFK